MLRRPEYTATASENKMAKDGRCEITSIPTSHINQLKPRYRHWHVKSQIGSISHQRHRDLDSSARLLHRREETFQKTLSNQQNDLSGWSVVCFMMKHSMNRFVNHTALHIHVSLKQSTFIPQLSSSAHLKKAPNLDLLLASC